MTNCSVFECKSCSTGPTKSDTTNDTDENQHTNQGIAFKTAKAFYILIFAKTFYNQSIKIKIS